jgi:signal transduction histidine kinase
MVVERHGGALTFETVPGRGTKFHVRVPIAGLAPAGEPELAAA